MPDLHGWISGQVDEAERRARRAAELCGCHPPAPSWSFRDGDGPTDGRILVVNDPHPDLKRRIGRRWNSSYEGLAMAEHVVRHDPAAALRRCEADRRVLARHRLDPTVHWTPACAGCGEYGDMEMPYTENLNDCPELLDLGYAHGLTAEILAALDRPVPPPQPPRPEPSPGFMIPDSIIGAYVQAIQAATLNARTVEQRLHVKVLSPNVPIPDWLYEDLGYRREADGLAPRLRALEILEPHLAAISLYQSGS